MSVKRNLSLRQLLEGMTLVFEPREAEGLEAVIQYRMTGEEPGDYFLRIAEGDCTFHSGRAGSPDLTIQSPSDVWARISRGEVSGQDALLQGRYTAEGDMNLLINMNQIFSGNPDDYMAPAGQRPAGPIALPGMAWLTVAFLPWMFFWITFEITGPRISILIPLILTLALTAYHLRFGHHYFFEAGAFSFFALAGLAVLAEVPGFHASGSSISSFMVGGLWLGSLVFTELPLSARYSKWQFSEKLWRTSMFIHPNAVISLMWGWQFLAAGLIGLIAVLTPEHKGLLTVVRYCLLVPAFVFTSSYQKGAPNRRIVHMERALKRVRLWAVVGLACGPGLVILALVLVR